MAPKPAKGKAKAHVGKGKGKIDKKSKGKDEKKKAPADAKKGKHHGFGALKDKLKEKINKAEQNHHGFSAFKDKLKAGGKKLKEKGEELEKKVKAKGIELEKKMKAKGMELKAKGEVMEKRMKEKGIEMRDKMKGKGEEMRKKMEDKLKAKGMGMKEIKERMKAKGLEMKEKMKHTGEDLGKLETDLKGRLEVWRKELEDKGWAKGKAPSDWATRMLMGVNIFNAMLALPVFILSIWMVAKFRKDCLTFLLSSTSTVGFLFSILVLLVSAAGFLGLWLNRLELVKIQFWCMLVLSFMLLGFTIFSLSATSRGKGQKLEGVSFENYKLTDYSSWLRKKIDSHWKSSSTCIRNGNFCKNLGNYGSASEIYGAKLSSIQAGCCVPPFVCGYMYEGQGTWSNPASLKADPDCGLWSDTDLCLNCAACKAGVLQNVKSRWRKASITAIVMASLSIGIVFRTWYVMRAAGCWGSVSKTAVKYKGLAMEMIKTNVQWVMTKVMEYRKGAKEVHSDEPAAITVRKSSISTSKLKDREKDLEDLSIEKGSKEEEAETTKEADTTQEAETTKEVLKKARKKSPKHSVKTRKQTTKALKGKLAAAESESSEEDEVVVSDKEKPAVSSDKVTSQERMFPGTILSPWHQRQQQPGFVQNAENVLNYGNYVQDPNAMLITDYGQTGYQGYYDNYPGYMQDGQQVYDNQAYSVSPSSSYAPFTGYDQQTSVYDPQHTPQQYDPQHQQYDPQSQQYAPQSQQYDPQHQQYDVQSQQYDPQSQQYDLQHPHYDPQQQQYDPQHQQYDPQQYDPQYYDPQQYDPQHYDHTQQYDPEHQPQQYDPQQYLLQQDPQPYDMQQGGEAYTMHETGEAYDMHGASQVYDPNQQGYYMNQSYDLDPNHNHDNVQQDPQQYPGYWPG